MHINEMNIELNDDERKALKKFFNKNKDFIKNHTFKDYNSIKRFADLYEKFLNDQKLNEDDILMLFLAELRYSELSYKITDNKNKKKNYIKVISNENTILNKIINKWYIESRIVRHISSSGINELNTNIQKKLDDNQQEKIKSLDNVLK